MSNPHVSVGIIAEDDSDVEAARIMMRRIAKSDRIGVKRFVGKGCGRLRRKCGVWAANLRDRGCGLLIVIHDLDRRGISQVRREIEDALAPCPIDNYLICIPVEEMEAWWLADPLAIRKALGLDRTPQVKGHPEAIPSPKERIGVLVRTCSRKRKIFVNTEHNAAIASELDFDKAKKCKSFVPFFEFVTRHMR